MDADPSGHHRHAADNAHEVVGSRGPARRKLTPPRSHGPVVGRDRLQALVNRAATVPMTVVAAPFGSGKTTLLRELAGAASGPVAWLSLDPSDNAPDRFLANLLDALDVALPGLRDAATALVTAAKASGVSTGSALAEAVSEQDADGLLLCLDDAHALTNPASLALVADLVAEAPAGMRVLLAGRSVPRLPLSTLWLRGMVAEVSAADLRLSREEGRALADALGSPLPPPEVDRLWSEMEGWVGGMLVALASTTAGRGAGPDTASAATVAGFATFAASILAELDPETQSLVVALSVPDEVCPRLAEALFDANDRDVPREAMAALGRSGLLAPSPSGGVWQRMHPVVRRALRQHLEGEAGPISAAVVHARASRWFAQAGMVQEAVRHAVAAGEVDEACDVVERNLARFQTRDDWRAVESLLRLLPADARQARPQLLLAAASVAHMSGRAAPISELEARARAVLADGTARSQDAAVLPKLALLRVANSVTAEQDPEAMLRAAQAVREVLSPDERWLAGFNYSLEAWALATAGRVPEAVESMHRVMARESEVIDACTIRPMIGLVWAHRTAGNLLGFEQACEDAFALASANGLALSAGWAAAFGGWAAYERDALELARQRFAYVEVNPEVQHTIAYREGMFGLALTQLALGSVEDARATVRRLNDFVLARRAIENVPNIRSFEARLALLTGDLGTARARIAETRAGIDHTQLLAFEHAALTRSQVCLAVGTPERLREARELVDAMRARAEHAHADGSLVRILAVSALVHAAAGANAEAVADLRASLAIGAPQGFFRTYLDLGPALAPLLRQVGAGAHPRMAELVDRLAGGEAGTAVAPIAPVAGTDVGKPSILSALSLREAEVLHALTRRLTNAEIADEMCISVQTVKSHLSNIYGKLGVGSRRQAIMAAAGYDLGLLDVAAPSSGPRPTVPAVGVVARPPTPVVRRGLSVPGRAAQPMFPAPRRATDLAPS